MAARTSSTEVTSPRAGMTSTLTARPAAKVRRTRSVSGCTAPLTAILSRPVAWTASIIASAAAVAPSYSEALATSMPVSAQIIDWNSKIVCSVPCDASAWYGV